MMNTHEQETPINCAKGCGFFGTTATSVTGTTVSRRNNPSPLKPPSNSLLKEESESVESTPKSDELAAKEAESLTEEVKRCMCCNKKFQVLGFKCKCGSTFCGSHRYPEQHNCTYDFKGAGEAVIGKENPLVVADKLQKI